jgi:hypothetical protein
MYVSIHHLFLILNPTYVRLFQTHSNQQYNIKFNQPSLSCTTHTTNNTSSTSKNTNTMIPPSHQLSVASIVMVSAAVICHPVANDLRNTAMLLFFYGINSSFILFIIILFAADWRACGQKGLFFAVNEHAFLLFVA